MKEDRGTCHAALSSIIATLTTPVGICSEPFDAAMTCETHVCWQALSFPLRQSGGISRSGGRWVPASISDFCGRVLEGCLGGRVGRRGASDRWQLPIMRLSELRSISSGFSSSSLWSPSVLIWRQEIKFESGHLSGASPFINHSNRWFLFVISLLPSRRGKFGRGERWGRGRGIKGVSKGAGTGSRQLNNHRVAGSLLTDRTAY